MTATANGTSPAIRARGLTKTFRLFRSPVERVRARLGLAEPRLLTAVRDVSFEVPRGGALGIVGENGAGKSTLLRLLAGITRPTAGDCRVDGRIGSILELGAGFHPEFTGRQNIRLSAALAGLDPARIEHLSEAIIDFSELGSFIDEPVKRYSSGMVVRLGFAIATRSRPDVLIVDEALSVGDGRFQKKCLDRIQAFLDGGGTLVLCSHALYYVTSMCDRALWLRRGEVAARGPANEVAREYEAHLRRDEKDEEEADGTPEGTGAPQAAGTPEAARAPQAPEARLLDLRLLAADDGGQGPPAHEFGGPWGLEIECEAERPGIRLHLGVGVDTVEGREVFACSTHRDGLDPLTGSTRYRVRLRVPELPLRSGEFTLHVFLLDEAGLHVYDRRTRRRAFRVRSADYSPALIDPPRDWDWPAGS